MIVDGGVDIDTLSVESELLVVSLPLLESRSLLLRLSRGAALFSPQCDVRHSWSMAFFDHTNVHLSMASFTRLRSWGE